MGHRRLEFRAPGLHIQRQNGVTDLRLTLSVENLGLDEVYVSPRHFSLADAENWRYPGAPVDAVGGLLFSGERLDIRLRFRLSSENPPFTLYWHDEAVGRIIPVGHGWVWQKIGRPVYTGEDER